MIRKLWIFLSITALLGQNLLFAFSGDQNIQEYYDTQFMQRGISVIPSWDIDTNLSPYLSPDTTQSNLDIGYRISLLPSPYQDQDEYFIYPKAGIVVPIVNADPADRAIMDQGQSIDELPYLQHGALHHRGKKPFEGPGNFTIAGHTSYYHNDAGDFKTTMQGLFLADPGDTLLYIRKASPDTFQRYIYTVTTGYEVDPSDVSILLPSTSTSYELTAYGCSPIGTTEKRRVVKSTLLQEDTIAYTPTEPLGMEHASAEQQSSHDALSIPLSLSEGMLLITPLRHVLLIPLVTTFIDSIYPSFISFLYHSFV